MSGCIPYILLLRGSAGNTKSRDLPSLSVICKMSDLNGQAATALFYLTTLLLCVGEGSSGTVSLPFSLILSFGRFGFNSSGIIPAIDLALEHIGNSSELLPGYKLQYTKVHDSEVS